MLTDVLIANKCSIADISLRTAPLRAILFVGPKDHVSIQSEANRFVPVFSCVEGRLTISCTSQHQVSSVGHAPISVRTKGRGLCVRQKSVVFSNAASPIVDMKPVLPLRVTHARIH